MTLQLKTVIYCCCCSVAKSCLTLRPQGLQHTRFPGPSLSLRVCSNSCLPLSQWCHPTISSSVTPFSFCLQLPPASGSFPLSWLFTSGCQSIGPSAWASFSSNEYSGMISFRIDWFDLLVVQGTLGHDWSDLLAAAAACLPSNRKLILLY